MATLKLTIDKRRAFDDGRYPIIFRLTSLAKSTAISTGIKLRLQEWDTRRNKVTKVHPDCTSLNLQLKNRSLELEKKLLDITFQSADVNVKELKEALLGEKKQKILSFKEFAQKEIQVLIDQERFGNASCYQTAVNRLLKFAGDDIPISKITYSLIVDFDVHLLKQGICKNTVAIQMRELRALINKAINQGLMDRSKYPFAGYKIRTEKTVNRAITAEAMCCLKKYPLTEGTPMWHSRNIFFLIFNLIGISFIDLALLKEENVIDGRIVYRRRKTGKMYSIKITEEARAILTLYKSEISKFLLPICSLEGIEKRNEIAAIHQRLKVCNTHLKELGKLCKINLPITTYVGRYSWANIAKTLGYSKDVIAEALGHEYGNQVTGIYLDNYGNEVIDNVNAAVVGAVMGERPA